MKEKLNNYIQFIKEHRYNFFFAGAITILLILIISMIVIITTNKGTVTNSATPTPETSQNQPSTQNDSSPKPLPITTPDEQQATIIENQTMPQISPVVAVPYTVTEITLYGDNWATIKINNPDVGGGAVISQKVDGAWKVVMGPGSYFPVDDLQSLGAPQELIDHITNQGGPNDSDSGSLSPIPSHSLNSGD